MGEKVSKYTMEAIKKIIKDYLSDVRKTQAIMLSGEWGCGKTFFVKENLIPDLEKDYQVYHISLYGISDTDTIQETIYIQWLSKELLKKFGRIGQKLVSGADTFGKSAMKLLESKLGLDDELEEVGKSLIGGKMDSRENTILIFDDIERCRIDIIKLMGFLNNLSENKGYSLLLIANEKEINQSEDEMLLAAKYNVALNSNIDTSVTRDAEISKETNNEGSIGKEKLNKITDYYFKKQTTYERTREKLIGLTVNYYIPLSESYDSILEKYVKEDTVKSLLIEKKDLIVKVFEQNDHRNLRTLISCFIVLGDILKVVLEYKTDYKELLEKEVDSIISYAASSSIKYAEGKNVHVWPIESRFGTVSADRNSLFDTKEFGYAFIDEYWKNQSLDTETVNKDLSEILEMRKGENEKEKFWEEHTTLALNSLMFWYMLPDETVKQLVKNMKSELAKKKYHPRDFKEIILTLMRINNPDFGLVRSEEPNGSVVYVSSDDAVFCEYEPEVKEAAKHFHKEWEEIDISSYVELMLKYLEDDENAFTEDVLRMISSDKQFVYEYRNNISPLITKLNAKATRETITNEKGESIIEMEWNEDFAEFCISKQSSFMSRRRFLSLVDTNDLIKKISMASAEELFHLSYAIKGVYSFGNLSDVFSSDDECVKIICEYLNSHKEGSLNAEKSRTKEMALSLLCESLSEVEKLLIK